MNVIAIFWKHSFESLSELWHFTRTTLNPIWQSRASHDRRALSGADNVVAWAHGDREVTTVFTTHRLHFQMTANNCFTWPWPFWPAGRAPACQVRFTGTSRVNDGQLKTRLFGRLESDSTDPNQCDKRLSFLQDERFKVVTPRVQITDGALHD